MTKYEAVKNYMEKLDLTEAEAEQLWQDERKMEEKSEGNLKQSNAKAPTVYKFNPPKKRPEDAEKMEILEALQEKIKEIGGVVTEVTSKQREFKFTYNENLYKINLIKPRVKKEV